MGLILDSEASGAAHGLVPAGPDGWAVRTLDGMDATPLVRLRWRLRGAWLWPAFLVLSVADAVILHNLPPVGDSEGLVGGWLLGAIVSLLGIALLGGAVGVLVRRFRPDMPRVVARDYAGALITLAVTLAFLAAGIAHERAIAEGRKAQQEAAARAEAYIGTHAPVGFQEHARLLYSDEVQASVIYRFCAEDTTNHYYCVIVNLHQPFGRSVRYAGSEPNSVLAAGTN